MNSSMASILFGLSLAVGMDPGTAAEPLTSPEPAARTGAGNDKLSGRWVRPDGGYVITIKGIDANGRIDAVYANPNVLPFAKAVATRDGDKIKLFFELRAGGYNGSTYALTYDPAQDVLKGVYYQAVAQQKYDIYFMRAAP